MYQEQQGMNGQQQQQPVQQQQQQTPVQQAQPVQQFAPQPQVQQFIVPTPQREQAQVPVFQQQQPQVQQQTQPQGGQEYDSVVTEIARHLGRTPDSVRQQLGNNPGAQIGAIVRDAIGVLSDQQQRQQNPTPVVQQQQQAASNADGTIQLPPGWQSYVRTNEQGVYEPIHPQFKNYADVANHNAIILRHRSQRIQEDPSLILQDPKVKSYIDDQVKSLVSQQVAAREIEDVRQQYRQKYVPEILEHGPDGNPKIGFDGKPIFTALGQAFSAEFEALAAQGVKEGRFLYERAMEYAKARVGVQNQQQQQGVGQQQQAQYQQPAQPNIQTLLSQINNNAMTHQAGQPPSRAQGSPSTLTGAAFNALNEMPEGQSAEFYFSKLGKLF